MAAFLLRRVIYVQWKSVTEKHPVTLYKDTINHIKFVT